MSYFHISAQPNRIPHDGIKSGSTVGGKPSIFLVSHLIWAFNVARDIAFPTKGQMFDISKIDVKGIKLYRDTMAEHYCNHGDSWYCHRKLITPNRITFHEQFAFDPDKIFTMIQKNGETVWGRWGDDEMKNNPRWEWCKQMNIRTGNGITHEQAEEECKQYLPT